MADAVNIPLDELEGRVHELPPPDIELAIGGPAEVASKALQWMQAHGRSARIDADYKLLPADEEAPKRRLWRAAPFLEAVADQIKPGTALDLACGTGRNAIYLAARGWRVTAVDRLADALTRGRQLVQRYACGDAIEWRCMDLEADPLDFGRRFSLVVCLRYLHRPLFSLLQNWLRPGGHVVFETFTTAHRAVYGKPRRHAFVLRPGELRSRLAGLHIHHYSEGWHDRAHTARVWAQREE